MRLDLYCYRKKFADCCDLDSARQAMERHIRACPEGEMPWADPVEWHEAETGWVTAARGEWLNHRVHRTGLRSIQGRSTQTP